MKWKKARLLGLLRSPDNARAEPRSYRPIFLLSALGKILEAILVARLGELYGELAPSQHGFLRGSSVEMAWLSVEDMVASSSAAYVLQGVRRILRSLRQSEVAMCPRCDYFNDRRVCVEGEVVSVWKEFTRGSIGVVVWSVCLEPHDGFASSGPAGQGD